MHSAFITTEVSEVEFRISFEALGLLSVALDRQFPEEHFGPDSEGGKLRTQVDQLYRAAGNMRGLKAVEV